MYHVKNGHTCLSKWDLLTTQLSGVKLLWGVLLSGCS